MHFIKHDHFSFIQGLTDIYGNGIQKFVFDTCAESLGEAQCKARGLTTSSVFAVDGPNLSIGEELIALFAVGTAAFITVLAYEVIYLSASEVSNFLFVSIVSFGFH